MLNFYRIAKKSFSKCAGNNLGPNVGDGLEEELQANQMPVASPGALSGALPGVKQQLPQSQDSNLVAKIVNEITTKQNETTDNIFNRIINILTNFLQNNNPNSNIKNLQLSNELKEIITQAQEGQHNNQQLIQAINNLTNIATYILISDTKTDNNTLNTIIRVNLYVWKVNQGAVSLAYLEEHNNLSLPLYEKMENGAFFYKFRNFLHGGNIPKENFGNKFKNTRDNLAKQFQKRTTGLLYQRNMNAFNRYLQNIGLNKREIIKHLNSVNEENFSTNKHLSFFYNTLKKNGIVNYKAIGENKVDNLYQTYKFPIGIALDYIETTYNLSPKGESQKIGIMNNVYRIYDQNISMNQNISLGNIFDLLKRGCSDNMLLLRANGNPVEIPANSEDKNIYIITDISLAVLKSIIEYMIPEQLAGTDAEARIKQFNNTDAPILTTDNINMESIYSLELAMILDSCQDISPLSPQMKKKIVHCMYHGNTGRRITRIHGLDYNISQENTLWGFLAERNISEILSRDKPKNGIFEKLFNSGMDSYRRSSGATRRRIRRQSINDQQ